MPERTLVVEYPNRQILGYDIAIDVSDARIVSQEDLSRFKVLKRHNLQTLLGERFNAELFVTHYQNEDGQLKNNDHNEPFIEIVRRGQRYRESLGSAETKREKAEIESFQKVEQILLDPDCPPQRKAVVISPAGKGNSIYTHNFVDVYSKEEDGTILMTRFSTNSNYQELSDAAENIDPFNIIPLNPSDADFIANPLITSESLDEIQSRFNPAKDTLSNQKYQTLIEACSPLITAYVNALVEKSNYKKTATIYNALLNFADEVVEPKQTQTTRFIDVSSLQRTINFFGNMSVRPVMGGCGKQNGFGESKSYNTNPFSVSEFGFGEDWRGTMEIKCKTCLANYQRMWGVLEAACRFCGGTEGIAC